MAGTGGGAWKVAYADFVTAMMAFFMVLWITSQKPEVKEAVAGYFRNPSNRDTTIPNDNKDDNRGTGGKADAGEDPTVEHLGGARPEPPPRIWTIHGHEVEVPGTVVMFPWLSAELTDEAKRELDKWIPQALGQRNILEIRGHTTTRPLPPDSPYKDLWQLAYARSMAVMNYLKDHGVESDRFHLSLAGPNSPLSISPDPISQQKNARVEIYVWGLTVEDMQGTLDERTKVHEIPFAPLNGGHF